MKKILSVVILISFIITGCTSAIETSEDLEESNKIIDLKKLENEISSLKTKINKIEYEIEQLKDISIDVERSKSELVTPFIPNKPIKKHYSGGYENTGYIEINYGIIKNKSLKIVKDGAGIHAHINIIDDEGIRFVYYENLEDIENISLNILDTYVQNREDSQIPVNPQLNDTWVNGDYSYEVTAIDKEITVPSGTFKTIEVTSTQDDEMGIKSYYYYAHGIGLIRSVTLGFESELLEYDYDVNLSDELLE